MMRYVMGVISDLGPNADVLLAPVTFTHPKPK
jgi:hypothetical protein